MYLGRAYVGGRKIVVELGGGRPCVYQQLSGNIKPRCIVPLICLAERPDISSPAELHVAAGDTPLTGLEQNDLTKGFEPGEMMEAWSKGWEGERNKVEVGGVVVELLRDDVTWIEIPFSLNGVGLNKTESREEQLK